MQLSDFNFDLPGDLIAQYPLAERSASRLLCLDKRSGHVAHRQFTQLPDLLSAGDLLVMNDTRVIPARLYGEKESGGKVEILVERLLDAGHLLAQVRASKSPRQGSQLVLQNKKRLEVVGRRDDLFELCLTDNSDVLETLEAVGHMPLPPYITREDEALDAERYQTVFAKKKGAVAAPTAGLHFDDALLQQCVEKGVDTAFVTLHVGAGTFQSVRVEDLSQHKMHTEWVNVSQAVCDKINNTKKNGGRIIAVGTTCVRSLETASQNGSIQPFLGETAIFIYPGYQFRCIDALVTNFHLPKSTLLMLVCAFAGYGNTQAAYKEAVAQRYRFFSYGDAMFIS